MLQTEKKKKSLVEEGFQVSSVAWDNFVFTSNIFPLFLLYKKKKMSQEQGTTDSITLNYNITIYLIY